ncbi:MAG TPA: glycerol-3-phosphate dehydrogenase/oxidase, partial [Burkholderiales bacterium]|nr:glycerol-3-phosphate dehydrogenase/oxidase [Burkholderiales bacterium]
APHLAQPLPLLLPLYGARGRWLEGPLYGAGLVLYDLLAGRHRFHRTEFLSVSTARSLAPGLQAHALAGAIRYWDGQFDDARLAVALARTAIQRGATVLSHCAAVELLHDGERVVGVVAEDRESGARHAIRAGCVVNATGVWVDALRHMDRPARREMVAPSQGLHLVVDREFLPGEHAVLVPKTRDGRVLFAVPWLGKVILGTTDTPRPDPVLEPEPFREEVDFILGEAAGILARAPTRADVRSRWVGLRPLVRPPNEDPGDTKALSREHAVLVERSGLVTVTGGKWTTYRAMAEDVLAHAMKAGLLPRRSAGVTAHLPLVGAPESGTQPLSGPPGLHLYGSEAEAVRALPGAGREIAPALSEAMVRFAARYEYARGVEDVLARRSRLLFLDADAAAAAAPRVAEVLAEELGAGFDAAASVGAFRALAEHYRGATLQ